MQAPSTRTTADSFGRSSQKAIPRSALLSVKLSFILFFSSSESFVKDSGNEGPRKQGRKRLPEPL